MSEIITIFNPKKTEKIKLLTGLDFSENWNSEKNELAETLPYFPFFVNNILFFAIIIHRYW